VNFLHKLEDFVTYCRRGGRQVPRVTVAVKETTARRVLGIRKREPLEYQGIPLRCIGSELYRKRCREAARETLQDG
jgi:hypothetical protein